MTVEAAIVPLNTFPKLLLRFVLFAVVVQLVATKSDRAANMLVFLILGSILLANKTGMTRFTRFIRFEIGG